VINSEIWDNIVSWGTNVACSLSEISCKFLLQDIFGLSNTICSSNNVVVNSKIWNKVVSWGTNIACFLSEISMHCLVQFCLRLLNSCTDVFDICINSKIWNWIVNWERWFHKSWCSDWNLPWNRSSIWSVLKNYS